MHTGHFPLTGGIMATNELPSPATPIKMIKDFLFRYHDGAIEMWSLWCGRRVLQFPLPGCDEVIMRISGDHLFAGAKSIHQWNIRTGKLEKTFSGHTKPVKAMKVRRNHLFTDSGEGTLKMWDIALGKCLHTFPNPRSHHGRLLVGKDCFFTFSSDKQAKVWDLAHGDCLSTRLHAEPITAAKVIQGVPYVGNSLGKIKVGNSAAPIAQIMRKVVSLKRLSDQALLIKYELGLAQVYDLSKKEISYEIPGLKKAASFSGKFLAWTSGDNKVHCTDLKTGEPIETLVMGSAITALFSKENQLLILAKDQFRVISYPFPF